MAHAHRFGPCCADALRAALEPHGYHVHELDDWEGRGAGPLRVDAFVWHHDASAPGYSPGMPDYIRREVDAGDPGANISITLDGTWHLIAALMTYHAGKVLPGMPGNPTSVGIETDHTTGETWSGVVMLDSMRIGTAALLEHHGHDASALHFHKTICAPKGRKNDPDGLDLSTERRAVAAIDFGEDDMFENSDRERLGNVELRCAGMAEQLTEIQNTLAGYATVDGKRADGVGANPRKQLSYIGKVGAALRTLVKPGSAADNDLKR